jgi:hypothetical protein
MRIRTSHLLRRWVASAAYIACAVMLLSGCASFPENTLGENGNPVSSNGLQVSLKPTNGTRNAVPEPILFDVILTNTGSEPIHLPRAPFVSLVWTFPNGVRDGKIPPDPCGILADPTAIVRLNSGKSVVLCERVQTTHFPKRPGCIGVIEFRAGYRSDLNLRSSTVGLWQGSTCSNTYGVEVVQGGTPGGRNRVDANSRAARRSGSAGG